MKDSKAFKVFIVFLSITLAMTLIPVDAQIKKRLKRTFVALLPDLTISISGPTLIYPGKKIGNVIKVTVRNSGRGSAADFYVGLFLSKDRNIRVGSTRISSNFREDAILKGGQEHIKALGPGAETTITFRGPEIPKDAPQGDFYFFAAADFGNSVKETDEANNLAFFKSYFLAQITEITHARWEEGPFPEMLIKGKLFGASQGSKTVKMGVYTLSIVEWTDTWIFPAYPTGIEFGNHYQVQLMQGNVVISNEYDFLLKMWVEVWRNKLRQELKSPLSAFIWEIARVLKN
ncbi:CARDB domain-containing protein [Acidobacteriota bacterium]